MTYSVPGQYYYRLHHPRPRFKSDVENVLVYVATRISRLPRTETNNFMGLVKKDIRMFPGNATKTEKTIDNWRTEISSLFGLIEFDSEIGDCWPGKISVLLADTQDLGQFFKQFLASFQYPGGHLKPAEASAMIEAGIKFNPAKYLTEFLLRTEERVGQRFRISRHEATHCIFNDLRVTRDKRDYDKVADLMILNRSTGEDYDHSGDVIRYAGDILDYMVLAKLLVLRGSHYYLNRTDLVGINAFLAKARFFDGYDHLYGTGTPTAADVDAKRDEWFAYVNQDVATGAFQTDIISYLKELEEEETELTEPLREYVERLYSQAVDTKAIGDMGENLIHGHECMRVKLAGRDDLIHLIKQIPDRFGVGYDILSVEADARKRHVEVKTTISERAIRFNQFHMTTNEWVVAEDLKESYYIYRLSVSRNGARLFLIQDPVRKYKDDLVRMVPRDGADLEFSDSSGQTEELLIWES